MNGTPRSEDKAMFDVRWTALAWVLTLGCARVGPELQVAGAVKVFQKSAASFVADRREIMQRRRALLNEQEVAAAELQVLANDRVAVWKVAADASQQKVYDQLLASTRAAAEASDKLDELREQHRAALAAADTHVKIQQEKLGEVAEKLTALGRRQGLAEQASFYFGYLKKTLAELKKLEDEANKTQAQQGDLAGALKAEMEALRNQRALMGNPR